MPENDVTDRVGLGVDLIGGAETLTTLRAIRAEMLAIVQLSGRGPNGPGGPGGPGGPSRVAAFKQEQGVITNLEVQAGLAQRQRKAELHRQIERAEEIHENRLTLIGRRAIEERQRAIATARRTPGYGQPAEVLQNTQQRALFQRYRNDPARDARTNEFRRQIANETVALREVLRERQKQAKLFEDFGRQSQQLVSGRRLAQVAEYDSRLRIIPSGENFQTSERLRQLVAARESGFRGKAFIGPQPVGENRIEAYRQQLRRERDQLIRETSYSPITPRVRPGSSVPVDSLTRAASEPDNIRTVGGVRGKFITVKGVPSFVPLDQLGKGGGPPPPTPPSGGGGGGKKGGEQSSGEGFLGPIGRLARNFVIYRALTATTFGLYNYTKASLDAAKATNEQANALRFATEAAGGNLEANRALAEQLGQFGYNRAQANQVVATAARATYRNPGLTDALAREAVNIAASRGGGIAQAPKVIEDILEGRDRTYREYFNATPEEIYKQAAKKRLAQNAPTPGLRGIGPQVYETDTQKISKYVAALTEEEKEQLRLNYVLSQAARFQGDAAERAGTLAGKMDLVAAAFFNASANVGAFIADLKPIKDLLDAIGGTGVGGIFLPPVIKQSGDASTVTEDDIRQYGKDATTGPRAKALERVSNLFGKISDDVTTVATSGFNLIKNRTQDSFEAITQYTQPGGPADSVDLFGDTRYNRLRAENQARVKQVARLNDLEEQGRVKYRKFTQGGNDPTEYSTYAQLVQQGVSGRDIVRDYVKAVTPVLKDGAKALDEYKNTRRDLVADVEKQGKGTFLDPTVAQRNLNALDAARDAAGVAAFKPGDYDVEAQKREDTRRQRELEDRNKYVQELGTTLSKLRDAQQGAFRLPGDIGTSIAGGDNPYVKVLSDQVTAAERMQQQWGFLGKAAVDYFTTLEQYAIKRELNKLEFQTFAQSSNLRGQSDREILTRGGPGLSRREQDYLDIQSAIVEQAATIPRLWAQAAQILGRTVGTTEELVSRVGLVTRAFGTGGPDAGFGNIYDTDLSKESGISRLGLGNPRFAALGQYSEFKRTGNPLFLPGGQEALQRRTGNPLFEPTSARDFSDIGKGQSPEVKNALRKSFADTVLDAFKDYSPAQIRASGLQSTYLGALQLQSGSLGYNIQQAKQKAEIGAAEDARLQKQLDADSQFRQAQLAKGYDAKDVGRESDSLLLARTEGIAPKDLTLQQFTARQDALRRQADRAEADRKEAKDAVKKGLDYQHDMVQLLGDIRQGLVGGNKGLLIQVQNDTQARVDQTSLQEIATGRYQVPLDQGEARTSPYTNSFTRYKRGGRK